MGFSSAIIALSGVIEENENMTNQYTCTFIDDEKFHRQFLIILIFFLIALIVRLAGKKASLHSNFTDGRIECLIKSTVHLVKYVIIKQTFEGRKTLPIDISFQTVKH